MDFEEILPLTSAQKAYDRRQFIESAGKGLIAATVLAELRLLLRHQQKPWIAAQKIPARCRQP